MNFIDSIKNTELVVSFIKNDEESLVVAMRGKISSSLTGALLDVNQSAFQKFVFASTIKWKRVVLDMRGLTYINSIGAAMLISLHRALKKNNNRVVLLIHKESAIEFTMRSIGFFTVENPIVVWDNYDIALRK